MNTDQIIITFYFKYNNHKEVLLLILSFCSLKLVGFLQVVTYA